MNLPTDPASNAQVNTRLAATAYVAPANPDLTAVQQVAMRLNTMLEQQGVLYRFTVGALAQAPAGGGGSSGLSPTALAKLEGAVQVQLAAPYVPGPAPVLIMPAPSSDTNACVVYGALETPANKPAAARKVIFRAQRPGIEVAGRLVTGEQLTIITAADGSFSVTLLRGVGYSMNCADLWQGPRYFTTPDAASMNVSPSVRISV